MDIKDLLRVEGVGRVTFLLVAGGEVLVLVKDESRNRIGSGLHKDPDTAFDQAAKSACEALETADRERADYIAGIPTAADRNGSM